MSTLQGKLKLPMGATVTTAAALVNFFSQPVNISMQGIDIPAGTSLRIELAPLYMAGIDALVATVRGSDGVVEITGMKSNYSAHGTLPTECMRTGAFEGIYDLSIELIALMEDVSVNARCGASTPASGADGAKNLRLPQIVRL